jgi:hypothetical protein
VAVWRRGHELRFPWPGDPVRLLAGNPTLGAPRYDLASLADELALYPARAARLVEPTAAPDSGAGVLDLDDQTARLILVLAIALAGVVLLAVLARVLRTPEAGDGA